MPTYEYHCDACEHGFEEFQSITASPLKKCPKCGKRKLRRVFGIGAAVLFKGSGFYQTDYRSESYKAAAKADQESSKPAAGDKAPANTADASSGASSSKSTKSAKGSKLKPPAADG
ncbi:MAG TPA: zinc ribbon domain-containing protein [Gemmataceae bacterium]|nr:zinc ribbon domain-containing protein [Gemmataceae bacterium]